MDQFIYNRRGGGMDRFICIKNGCWDGLVHLYQGMVGWTSSFTTQGVLGWTSSFISRGGGMG